ncbi:MAG: hypothetical protein KatS3mg034_1757 [Vicingaceae bacterium]|nr:MAG: hypothetical protein KatS3mg034_1757 [Vicingaceae bacterium]
MFNGNAKRRKNYDLKNCVEVREGQDLSPTPLLHKERGARKGGVRFQIPGNYILEQLRIIETQNARRQEFY